MIKEAAMLIAELCRLRAENAELRRDAERYRWLRDGDSVEFKSWHACSLPYEQLDAAIDAAMQNQ